MLNEKRIKGVVVATKPAGGRISSREGDYYISIFEPLAGKIAIGTKVSFMGTHPGDGRGVAEGVIVIKKATNK